MRRNAILLAVFGVLAVGAEAAEYRVVAGQTDVLAGETISLFSEVETLDGDNLVGEGHFAFALDFTLSGDAGAVGADVSNVVINESLFDDTLSNFIGYADGFDYVDVGGVTTDAISPNFGSAIGDVIGLFTFDLTVPAGATLGSEIVITPREGFLRNVTVNDSFDVVSPQSFEPVTLTVVPEPSVWLLLAGGLLLLRRR